jgi:hypothetical protein
MWSFRYAIFCCCQDNLEGICCAQFYRLRERDVVGESGLAELGRVIYELKKVQLQQLDLLVLESRSNARLSRNGDDCLVKTP